MTINIDDTRVRRAMRDLIAEIEVLSADFGPQVQEAVEAARDAEISADIAERLYARILVLLRNATGVGNDEDVADEVRRLLGTADDEKPWGKVNLVERNGLKPHLVQPVPTFNNISVPMWEGYVDVSEIDLWRENHRVELQVAEFRDRNHREPEDEELLQLMFGELYLPSLDKKDPFKIRPLANSIARKGVERPPILTSDGEPKDGNRRLAAAKFVLTKDGFATDEQERARWVKVWVAPPETTPDQFEAVVVALNFEDDLKEKWPEYVKARLVVRDYRKDRDDIRGSITAAQEKRLKEKIAHQYAITVREVTRYIRMVRWADEFEDYHIAQRGMDASEVRYKADEIFQWFYEIDAGKAGDKITPDQLDDDDELKKIVYDLMFEVMDTGVQVRSLHKIVADEGAMEQLQTAHQLLEQQDKKGALELVREAVITADRKTAARKKIGFEGFLISCVDRLGGAPPDNWRSLTTKLLIDLERVFRASLGTIEAELVVRGERAVTGHD
ncbi:hypothetical protein ACU610_21305 [Geodermatophilus sp. URMC 61]|uniref:hypothetical protein n=1 Tax=Geodermatophilus sp. URMC 61 TaxID=3423411 RepID=UPI00406D36DD